MIEARPRSDLREPAAVIPLLAERVDDPPDADQSEKPEKDAFGRIQVHDQLLTTFSPDGRSGSGTYPGRVTVA